MPPIPRLFALTALATALVTGQPAGATGAVPTAASAAGDSAEGFWVAATPSGIQVKWAILEDGETWGIYEAQGTVLGAFHGVTRSAGGALFGSGSAFDIPSASVGATTHTGSYTARQTITLTTAFGVQISGRYAPGYDQPASLAALQGRFGGESLGSRGPVVAMALSVAPDGAFVMTSREDCAASGQLTPRPGGKAVFNIRLRFAGQACALGDGASASGVAHVSEASGELFVLALNDAKTDGWLYLGARTTD
jgi:hypothetical protein